ncbi:MAG: cation:proton antiporter [Actinobacteria bacterium]|nr:cation:proton antiporter [Actinomycetota bacterium]
MDVSELLLHLVIVLVAAKLAAEGAERIGVPAVVGEIVAGIVVGPSLLGLVGREDEVLRFLGELGVILLLLDVGLEMDIGELRKVGRASISVATIGVVLPMVTGIAAMRLMGESGNTALFVGAALTATSVGITARVFGDLRALATSEARIVLGAAVADDVMGLLVLTVVVRLVTEGSVSPLSIAGIVAVALAFLVVGGGLGIRVAPALFGTVNRLARSGGTLVALAFAFTLGFAELADKAKLAPIIGAFLAGLALGKTDSSERIRSELAPIGHVLVPIFFLQIGIDAELSAFGRASVLTDAAILLVVAVVGKVAAAVGAKRTEGDRLLIGLGMLPRGEVGLIFATIGLSNGVLGEDLYAALLLVVLATTLMTPPLLKVRSRTVMARARSALRARGGGRVEPVPVVVDGVVDLPGTVDEDDALELALRAAVAANRATAGSDLVTWLAGIPGDVATGWDEGERELLLDVIERGNARSWRFLESTGTLDRTLPELARALHRRRADPTELDLDGGYRFPALERLRILDGSDPAVEEARRIAHPDQLLVAALLVDALDGEPDPVDSARALVARIGLDATDRAAVVALVADRHLLWAAARRTSALAEDNVRQLAAHLATPERARATYVLAALRDRGHERWELARLQELHRLLQDTLAREAPDADERDLLEQRRTDLAREVGDDDRAVGRALAAPARFLLVADPAEAARQFASIDPLPPRRELRVHVEPGGRDDRWWVEVVARDRTGILAGTAAALAASGCDVVRAEVATWPDGAALELFEVRGPATPDPDALTRAVDDAVSGLTEAGPLPDVSFRFDHRASPWHSVCEIDAPERAGLLAEVAAVLRAAGITVRSASARSADGRAYDVFELTTTDGRKLEPADEDRIRAFAASGVSVQRRRFGSRVVARPG